MENSIATIHSFLFIGITTLLLFQSIILFIQSKNNPVKKTMAYLELLWAFIFALSLVLLNMVFSSLEYTILREKVLIIGNLYITFTHFFPMQILLPGWLNWKRGFLLVLPILLLTAIYYGGMYLLGETPEKLCSYSMLWDSIGHFNVWFRFVMLFSNIIYIATILLWLYSYEKKYTNWENNNFADQEYMDISWMRTYDFIIIGIFTFYLGILFFGGHLSVICHGLFFVSAFSYLFYKTLFYESPYPKDYFAEKTAGDDRENIANDMPVSSEIENLNEQTFENKIPSYCDQIKQWMNNEKPYLYNDFKLTDVSRVLPLNRSYLSRVFNEGFGQNFSEVIRTYRINYSMEILRKEPSLPMHKIAEMSGFRSDSTYIKAFKQIIHMTPSQYKALEVEKVSHQNLSNSC